jgi:tRNA(Ile)-lysidine synthase
MDSLDIRNEEQVGLNLAKLGKLHPAILGRVIKRAVSDVSGSTNNIASVHYRSVTELISKGKTGATAELPGGVRAVISYGVLMIQYQRPQEGPFEKSLNIPGITEVEELGAVVKTDVYEANSVANCERMGYNSFVQIFDYNSLDKGIHIRNRRDGDIFRPYRSNGTKKLKKYFIDSKIPRETRERIPLVCFGNEVVWVVGYKISDKFKVTENTKSVIKIEFNRRTQL